MSSLYMGHIPDSKVHGANMGPTTVQSAPDGPHIGPMSLAIGDSLPGWDVFPIQFSPAPNGNCGSHNAIMMKKMAV